LLDIRHGNENWFRPFEDKRCSIAEKEIKNKLIKSYLILEKLKKNAYYL
tara:strand:- start:1404 stop:1550 length:147 start_codon:yes stop_codon:yes gene_type:complete